MERLSHISNHFRLWKLLLCFHNLQLVPSGVVPTEIKHFLKTASLIQMEGNIHNILPYIVVMDPPILKKKLSPPHPKYAVLNAASFPSMKRTFISLLTWHYQQSSSRCQSTLRVKCFHAKILLSYLCPFFF